jgi:ornithine cyclodeaminase/alanine dehydrogenase
MVLILTRKDVESLLAMKDTLVAVENAFRELALGSADMPVRLTIRAPKYSGLVSFMPAYIGGMDALGMKLVSAYKDNPSKYNLPTILATIMLNDPKTGALTAIMDGAWITAMRTGAVSGVATKYLAREDAKTVGIFGTGVQARTQLMAMKEVRKLGEVKAYDIIPESSRKFAKEMTEMLGITVIPAKNPMEAVVGSDIIIASTTSKVPVFNGDWLKDGAHVNGIGSHHGPGTRELDEATIKKAKVVVDQKDACLKEAGDLLDLISNGTISPDHIYGELGELVTGKKKGRTSNTEITVFKSVGLAIQDVATAINVYELAKGKGIGKTIEI